ncbi:MAG TPA: alpha/beta hydrolase [Rhizomicrobium sp.]|jgi:pimeloyl-ACP methyl ester carboxylesterase|nr:alpha/beta hydrolase [Rhizomicrobium sp.]
MAAGGAVCLAAGAKAATGIDQSGFVRIGGIEQWIAIQGRDAGNPAIVYLHGGPGEAQSPFLEEFIPWEKDFTVVNWDQRGSGKTYEKNGKTTPDVTLDRLADDAVELTRHVLKRLNKSKLILVGQSFGAMLGLMVVKRAPELYYAFVGTGQFVNNNLTMAYRERWARREALAAHDTAGLKALDAVRTLSVNDWKRIAASRKWMMSPPDQAYLKTQADFTGPLSHPRPAARVWIEGYGFEANQVGKQSIAFDAMREFPSLPVPYVLIQGRNDHVTPFQPAKAYFDKVRSKGKIFVPIDGGHYACFTNPRAFVAALDRYVRPLATQAGIGRNL